MGGIVQSPLAQLPWHHPEKVMFGLSAAVIIDADVAALYCVETRRVNEAVRNNPDKFPTDYMFELTTVESREF